MIKNKEILAVFPDNLSVILEKTFGINGLDIYEIRLSEGRKMYLNTSEGIRFVTASGALSCLPDLSAPAITSETLEELTDKAVGYSAYAHSDELCQGYVTYGAGYRIGIACDGLKGQLKSGKVNSVCIRLPVVSPEIKENELDDILDNLASGLLIAGPPACGKTTLLRYCAKRLSDGVNGYRRVCVIDERRELAGINSKSFDLGCCTDIISGCPKHEGIMTALRCFSPEIIICDEIGTEKEADCILEGLNSGVCFVSSMHAGNLSQLVLRSQFRRMFRENVFSHVAVISSECKGRVEKIYSREAVNDEIYRTCYNGDILPVIRSEYSEIPQMSY